MKILTLYRLTPIVLLAIILFLRGHFLLFYAPFFKMELDNCPCWQCSEFVNILPELMDAIQNLKKKIKETDEDNILQEVISRGNVQITEQKYHKYLRVRG